MASLVTARMRFLHVPKTGGTWATQAILAAGVGAERPATMPFYAGLSDPGAASRIFAAYVGPSDAEIGFVGRFERLADDLCLALRLAGEDFSEGRLRSQPRVNATDYGRCPALYTPSLAASLAEAEREAIERFHAELRGCRTIRWSRPLRTRWHCLQARRTNV